MATTTPNYGWTVPTSTDLVKDGATAIETLGDAIDASLVNLRGGSTGQVLTKTSATQMDFAWGAGTSGLVKLSTTTFSAVGSQAIPLGSFTSTYDNYVAFIQLTAASTTNIALFVKMRSAGTDTSSSYYYGGNRSNMQTTAGNTAYGNAGAATTGILIGGISSSGGSPNGRSINKLELFGPFLSAPTMVLNQGIDVNSSESKSIVGGGHLLDSTSYDQFNLIASTGTISGNISIYGVTK